MFHSARIKLTAWYLLIIMSVSIFFSAAMYNLLSNEVIRFDRMQRFRIEREYDGIPHVLPPRPNPNDMELINEVNQRIAISLLGINALIFVIAGGLGYLLAGKTLKPIQEMVDDQSRFVSDASHELRTPLTALKSSMEVFLRDKDAGLTDARSLIKESIDDVDNLNELSSSLLQLAQYQEVTGNVKFEKVGLRDLITDAVSRVEPLAKNKNVTIVNESTGYEVKGVRSGLNELIIILLDNAIKYSRENGKVTVTTEKTDHHIKLLVKDEGIGIKTTDIPHIFDRFYRADVSRSEVNTAGYGLGLAIAKRIVELHHGTISVESKINEGSVFVVSLPSSARIQL
jgi:two-component system, OmpR family, sensor histidine kinase CiaH